MPALPPALRGPIDRRLVRFPGLAFAEANPVAAQVLTVHAAFRRGDGSAAFTAMVDRFATSLNHDAPPLGRPERTARNIVIRIARQTLLHLETRPGAPPTEIAPALIIFALTPYVGLAEAQRWAAGIEARYMSRAIEVSDSAHPCLVPLQTKSYGARMQTMRDRWTDQRLDDLNDKVDRGFERMDARFDRVDARFERMDARFEALHRLLVQGGVVIIAALIGLIATQL